MIRQSTRRQIVDRGKNASNHGGGSENGDDNRRTTHFRRLGLRCNVSVDEGSSRNGRVSV